MRCNLALPYNLALPLQIDVAVESVRAAVARYLEARARGAAYAAQFAAGDWCGVFVRTYAYQKLTNSTNLLQF